MKREGRRNPVWFMTVLVGLIVMLAVMLLVFSGARLREGLFAMQDRETAQTLLWTKLRQANGTVSVATLAGRETLLIAEDIAGERYYTALFFDGDYLSEGFYGAGQGFSAELGEQLVPLKDCRFLLTEGGLLVRVTGRDGITDEVHYIINREGA